MEGLRGMMPGSDNAVSHRLDMANAHSDSPTVARTPPPRTGNLEFFFGWRFGSRRILVGEELG